MTASTEVKAVMVMVSGHGRKILVVVEDGLGANNPKTLIKMKRS